MGQTTMSNGKKKYEQIQGFIKLKGRRKHGKRNFLQISKRPTHQNDK